MIPRVSLNPLGHEHYPIDHLSAWYLEYHWNRWGMSTTHQATCQHLIPRVSLKPLGHEHYPIVHLSAWYLEYPGLPLNLDEIGGKFNAGGQGGREGPLAGSRDSVPVGAWGRSPRRKIGVSGHFEAKYGLFWHGILVPASYRLSLHKYTRATTLYTYTYKLSQLNCWKDRLSGVHPLDRLFLISRRNTSCCHFQDHLFFTPASIVFTAALSASLKNFIFEK